LDDVNQKVQDLSNLIKLQLPKESLNQDQRELVRMSKVAVEEEDRRKFEEQQHQIRLSIDANFAEAQQALKAKYALV